MCINSIAVRNSQMTIDLPTVSMRITKHHYIVELQINRVIIAINRTYVSLRLPSYASLHVPLHSSTDAKHQCGFFFALLGADWARDVDCDALPDSDNEDVCTGGWQRDRLAERRLRECGRLCCCNHCT